MLTNIVKNYNQIKEIYEFSIDSIDNINLNLDNICTISKTDNILVIEKFVNTNKQIIPFDFNNIMTFISKYLDYIDYIYITYKEINIDFRFQSFDKKFKKKYIKHIIKELEEIFNVKFNIFIDTCEIIDGNIRYYEHEIELIFTKTIKEEEDEE